jgi:hypothetical protein
VGWVSEVRRLMPLTVFVSVRESPWSSSRPSRPTWRSQATFGSRSASRTCSMACIGTQLRLAAGEAAEGISARCGQRQCSYFVPSRSSRSASRTPASHAAAWLVCHLSAATVSTVTVQRPPEHDTSTRCAPTWKALAVDVLAACPADMVSSFHLSDAFPLASTRRATAAVKL